jgi:hypothetical protein
VLTPPLSMRRSVPRIDWFYVTLRHDIFHCTGMFAALQPQATDYFHSNLHLPEVVAALT